MRKPWEMQALFESGLPDIFRRNLFVKSNRLRLRGDDAGAGIFNLGLYVLLPCEATIF